MLPGRVGHIFVSYSHADPDWCRRFRVMLEPLVRGGSLALWLDPYIQAGDDWRREIDEAVEGSVAALLLVSPEFLASPFIMDEELPALREKGVRLFPVLVRECLWEEVESLERVQWVHDPRKDGPLATNPDPDGAVTRACKAIKAALADDAATAPAPSRRVVRASAATPLPGGSTDEGALFDVPALPTEYVVRDDIERLRAALLASEEALGFTGRATLGLYGDGGIGKSVLAAALGRDSDIRRHFPDGVYWVTVGEQADLVRLQTDLLERLGRSETIRSTPDGVRALRDVLHDQRCLLIVDDVWSAKACRAFQATGPLGRVLYTTRDRRVLDALGADVEAIDVLPVSVARRLLTRLTGARTLPAVADSILAATGRVALAVALVGAALKGADDAAWARVADELERRDGTFLDHPYANTFKAMTVALGLLDDVQAKAYRALAVFPEDAKIPVSVVERFWSHLGLDGDLATLAERELLQLGDASFEFHDLQREFLLLRASDLELLHGELIEAFRALLPEPDAWSKLPADEDYVRDRLLYHLAGAVDPSMLEQVAGDLGVLAQRIFRDGLHAAEQDLQFAQRFSPDDERIQERLQLVTNWGHLLTDASDLESLVATLLPLVPPQQVVAGLEDHLPDVVLTHVWGLPQPARTQLRSIKAHSMGIDALAFSDDGLYVATIGPGDEHYFAVWNVRRGDLVAGIPGPGVGSAVAFLDATRLLLGTTTGLHEWDLRTGETTDWANGSFVALSVSDDGTLVATCDADGTVQLWNIATRSELWSERDDPRRYVTDVVFAPGSTRLAVGNQDTGVELWDAATAEKASTPLESLGPDGGIVFSPRGDLLAAPLGDGSIGVVDIRRGQPSVLPADDIIAALAFSTDGTYLVSAGWSQTVNIWDVRAGHMLTAFAGHTDKLTTVAVSPAGDVIASGSDDGTVRLWRWELVPSPHAAPLHAGAVSGVSFSPDGRSVATADDEGEVRFWHAADGAPSRPPVSESVYGRGLVRFHPSGDRVATKTGIAPLDAAVKGENRWARARDAAFSRDGTRLVVVDDERTVLWDAESMRVIHKIDLASDAVAFAPDDSCIACVDARRRVRVFDPSLARERSAPEHGWVTALAFSPDASMLLTAGADGKVWAWPERRLISTLDGHASYVTSAVFAPDGSRVATLSGGTLHVWSIPDGRELCAVRLAAQPGALDWHDARIAVAVGRSVVLLDVLTREQAIERFRTPR